MSEEPIAPRRIPTWVPALIAFIVAFDIAAFWQWRDGAFQSEFGGHQEESMHYVTGLSMRDSVVKKWEPPGESGPKFSEVFAGNEPKATTVSRAPALAAAEAGWMLVFGSSRLATLLFMAALAAGSAVLIFCVIRRECGDWAGAAGALLWLCAPAVRESDEMIMPDIFTALTLTGAVLLWVRVLDGGRVRDAMWCGILSAMVMAGDGGFLVLAIPVLLLLLARRCRRDLAQPATWLAASIPAILGGLWLWRHPSTSWQMEPRALAFWTQEAATALGLAATFFAVAGLITRWRSAKGIGTTWTAMTLLVIGVILARWIGTGAAETHSLIPATPALAMLAATGAASLAGLGASQPLASSDRRRRGMLWVLLLLLLSLPQSILHDRQKDWQGFAPIALTLLDEAPKDARVLVVSDPRGEGMLISELAMRDRRTGISVERGSETLVDPAAVSPRGRPLGRFLEDEQLIAYLGSGKFRYIVMDSAVPDATHADYHDQVLRVLEENPRKFWPLSQSPITRDGEPQGHPLRIFRVITAGSLPE